MKKNQRIINLFFILTLLFSTFIYTKVECWAVISDVPTIQHQSTQNVSDKKNIKSDNTNLGSIPQKNAYALSHMEKTGFKYSFLKFFIAMFGVLLSSLAIFIGLKVYKKLILKDNEKFDNIDYDKTLESPKDFKEAINLFLDKTNR